jgi:hypothetical protein
VPRSMPNEVRRAIIATGAVALIAALTWSRGIAAAATSLATPSAETHALNVRIAALERRIAELEAARSGVDHATTLAPATVRAPFIVLDASDKVLLRVDRSARTGFARLTVGDSTGSAAALVAATEGGALQLVDATSQVRLTAIASKTRTGVTMFLRAGKAFMGGNDDGLPTFQARNLGEMPVAELRAMVAQNGQLILTDEAGTVMVRAGTSTKGVGIVKMGPNGNGPAALLGNAGMAASEIEGKKDK